jgi:hypothetical protein
VLEPPVVLFRTTERSTKMISKALRAFALMAVAALALTVFVAAGSASNVRPHPFQSGSITHPDGFGSGDSAYDVRSTAPDQDVRSRTAPKVDVRAHAPKVDVRTHAPKIDVYTRATRAAF